MEHPNQPKTFHEKFPVGSTIRIPKGITGPIHFLGGFTGKVVYHPDNKPEWIRVRLDDDVSNIWVREGEIEGI